MIGKKTLSQIREGLAEACQQAEIDPETWVGEQLQELKLAAVPQPHEIETLELIRDGLRPKSVEPKRTRKNAKSQK